MTSAWDAHGGPRPPSRHRRIRGGPADAGPTEVIPVLRVVEQPSPAAPDEGLVAFRIGRRAVDADGLFALALFLPMLFLDQLTSRGAAMIAGLAPLYLFVRRDRLVPTLAPRSFLFLVPAFALFSILWSAAQSETLRYGVELAITVTAGLLLSSARNQRAVLRGMMLAFLAYVIASIVYGGYVGIGVGLGGQAFSGLTESKNLLADIASTGLVVSAVVAAISLRGRQWAWFLLCALAIALDVYCVAAARSAGAILGLAMAVTAFAALTPLVYAGKVVRAWATSMVAICLVAIGANYTVIAEAMIRLGASLFDKDPTLTGRTYLWYRAAELIQQKPLLGRGYQAFWIQGNIDAEGLWRYFGIDNRGGFTFHNTYVEILVTMGWVGLALIGAVFLVGVIALVRQFVLRPSLTLVFWMSILLYELARTPIETIGVSPFYFSTAPVFGALGAAFLDRQRVHAARPHYRPPGSAEPTPADPPGWANPRPAAPRRALRLVKPDEGRR
jgi:exopolysaccharide production protein ExoQ